MNKELKEIEYEVKTLGTQPKVCPYSQQSKDDCTFQKTLSKRKGKDTNNGKNNRGIKNERTTTRDTLYRKDVYGRYLMFL